MTLTIEYLKVVIRVEVLPYLLGASSFTLTDRLDIKSRDPFFTRVFGRICGAAPTITMGPYPWCSFEMRAS
eukprot:4127077-Pyramimonas_sp.AAC.1